MLRLTVVLALLASPLAGCTVLGLGSSIEAVMPKGVTDGGSPESLLDGEGDTPTRISVDSLREADPQSRIGEEQHPKILQSYGGVFEDEKLEQLLALIVGKLVAVSDEPGRAYTVTVLNSPTVNAFALPGGYLYITRGLLALANDSSEVAAVLAHEMAHVSSNHGIKRSEQAKAVDIAERVASDVVSDKVIGQVVKASTERRLAAFSQGQEYQADAVGIKMLGRAGFDPYAAARFLESMDRFANWRSALSNGDEDMNSSHPSTPQRIELARRHARLFGPEGSGERSRERFLKGVDGLLFGDKLAEGAIRDKRFSHPNSGFTFEVPDGFELANKETAVLASGPNQSALRFDAVAKRGQPSVPSDYLKSGWVNGLDEASIQKIDINGLPAATGRATAGDWQFVIAVVEFRERYYRFIMAAPRSNTGVAENGLAVARSFRALTDVEKARLKPLQVKVVAVSQDQSIADLASQMNGVSRKVDLFRALNGLSDGDRVKSGMQVKVISEG